jgi:hypothetical protein
MKAPSVEDVSIASQLSARENLSNRQDQIKARGKAAEQLRGSGRTTAGMLRAIAFALENPDQRVPYMDHSGATDPELFRKAFLDMFNRLGLKMCVVMNSSTVGVYSMLSELRGIEDAEEIRIKYGD